MPSRAEETRSGPPGKCGALFWGEETQRKERAAPQAARRGIWSVWRRGRGGPRGAVPRAGGGAALGARGQKGLKSAGAGRGDQIGAPGKVRSTFLGREDAAEGESRAASGAARDLERAATRSRRPGRSCTVSRRRSCAWRGRRGSEEEGGGGKPPPYRENRRKEPEPGGSGQIGAVGKASGASGMPRPTEGEGGASGYRAQSKMRGAMG